jgi:hypothetical protein
MHEIILLGGCIEWLMYDSGYYFYSKHAKTNISIELELGLKVVGKVVIVQFYFV